MNMKETEVSENLVVEGVEPRYNFFQGYDKSPALSFDKVKALTTGTVIKIIGFYIGGINYNEGDRGEGNAPKSFTKELRKQYLTRVKLAYIYHGRTDEDSKETEKLIKVSKNLAKAKEEGITDALEAKRLAEALEVPSGSVIYLDIEGGNLHNEFALAYVQEWVNKINKDTDYWAGIYCSAGSQCKVAQQLYTAVDKKANMYIGKWMEEEGYYYDMATGETYQTSYTRPAKWYDLDPTEAIPDAGCIIRQYSGRVCISLQGVNTIVDQLSSTVPDPSVKQYT